MAKKRCRHNRYWSWNSTYIRIQLVLPDHFVIRNVPGSFPGFLKGTNFAPIAKAIGEPNMKPRASIPRKKKRRERSFSCQWTNRKPHYLALLITNLSKWSEVLCYNTIKSFFILSCRGTAKPPTKAKLIRLNSNEQCNVITEWTTWTGFSKFSHPLIQHRASSHTSLCKYRIHGTYSRITWSLSWKVVSRNLSIWEHLLVLKREDSKNAHLCY